jgi:hypothetical protein
MDTAAPVLAIPAASNGNGGHTATTSGAPEIRTLRRAFIRQLGIVGRPNAYISTLASSAAMATILARESLSDPRATANDKVRLAGMARKARRDLQHAAAAKPPEKSPPTLKELLHGL